MTRMTISSFSSKPTSNMADNISAEHSAPLEPDSSENAPLLQEQEDQPVNLGPPPPFVASE